jgi:hypothetical protein
MDYVQAFYVENSKIILDNLPQEIYNGMNEDGFLSNVDNSPWTTKINILGRTYHLIFSKRQETVSDFMNGVFYLEGETQ